MKTRNIKPQNLEHVQIIKIPDKRTYDTSLENSSLGDHRF